MANITLQPTTGLDTYMRNSTFSANNYSAENVIYSGESNGASWATRALIKFIGLSDGTIAPPVTVTSAILSLYRSVDLSSNARTKRVYRVKQNIVFTEVTWDVYSSGNNWSTAGCGDSTDRETSEIGHRDCGASDSGWFDFTLDNDAIAAIINGSWTNNGFVIITDTEVADCFSWYSSEYTNPAYIPKLYIEYEAVSFVPYSIMFSKKLNWDWWKRGGLWVPNNGLATI